jgi:hypothetical protein
MESVEAATVVKVFDRKIWIESDFMGSRHVMIQHDDGESEPFCYCSFFYDHRYTSNGGTLRQAENMAKALGATEVIHHSREFTGWDDDKKSELTSIIEQINSDNKKNQF